MQEVNKTFYHNDTNSDVIKVLEQVRQDHTRIQLDLGDAKTGRDWNEVHDITGYVGRSMGPKKIPILVYNSRSFGGGAILDHCIVKFVT